MTGDKGRIATHTAAVTAGFGDGACPLPSLTCLPQLADWRVRVAWTLAQLLPQIRSAHQTAWGRWRDPETHCRHPPWEQLQSQGACTAGTAPNPPRVLQLLNQTPWDSPKPRSSSVN